MSQPLAAKKEDFRKMTQDPPFHLEVLKSYFLAARGVPYWPYKGDNKDMTIFCHIPILY